MSSFVHEAMSQGAAGASVNSDHGCAQVLCSCRFAKHIWVMSGGMQPTTSEAHGGSTQVAAGTSAKAKAHTPATKHVDGTEAYL